MIDLTTFIPYVTGAVVAVLTTFFGYYLNENSKKKDKNEKKMAAKHMIKIEIDHDLKLLKHFYIEIKNTAKDNRKSLGYNMGNLSFPPVDKAVFNKYSFLLSDSKDNEFENVYNFYRVLGDLQILHSKTAKISNKSYSPFIMESMDGRTMKFPGNTGERYYSNQFTELWGEFESIICSLIKKGNPIL